MVHPVMVASPSSQRIPPPRCPELPLSVQPATFAELQAEQAIPPPTLSLIMQSITDGLLSQGTYDGGLQVGSFTVSSVVTYVGAVGGGMGGPGGKPQRGP